MQSLRSARIFGIPVIRLVLAWFALTLGAAVASPIIQPQAMQLICSGSGAIKLLISTDDGVKEAAAATHTLDCPLCAALAAPPPALAAAGMAPSPWAHALTPRRAAHIAAVTAAPPPGRGPPVL